MPVHLDSPPGPCDPASVVFPISCHGQSGQTLCFSPSHGDHASSRAHQTSRTCDASTLYPVQRPGYGPPTVVLSRSRRRPTRLDGSPWHFKSPVVPETGPCSLPAARKQAPSVVPPFPRWEGSLAPGSLVPLRGSVPLLLPASSHAPRLSRAGSRVELRSPQVKRCISRGRCPKAS